MSAAIINARILASFMQENLYFSLQSPHDCKYCDHIGALFTDAILQSGVNYKNVVLPRVCHILRNYPDIYTVSKFYDLLETEGTERVLMWNHKLKINRIYDLINFCLFHNLNEAHQIKSFLVSPHNKRALLSVNGIGYKTVDYLLKLLNVDIVAIDRHIFSFVEQAGIPSDDYMFVKSVVEYAADIMNVSRRAIDYSIWSYMSNHNQNAQLSFQFY